MTANLDTYAALAQLFNNSRPVVQDQWYHGVAMNLDGYHFKRCRFDNCTLNFATADFVLTECFINHDVSFGYPPNAIRIVKLYNAFHASSRLAGFQPTFHANGTISIGPG